MNSLIESLLQPVSAEQPGGAPQAFDRELDELETLLKGKPEVEMGSIRRPAEPPDWGNLERKSAEFLGHSKHLRAALIYCCCALKTRGLEGFRDGLELIAGLLERFWNDVQPLLEPEDNNDPTRRLNIVGAITQPRGSVSGWLTIVDYLYVCPLVQRRGSVPVSLDLAESLGKAGPGEGDLTDAAKLAAAVRGADPKGVGAQREAVRESRELVGRIDQALSSALGNKDGISFEVIANVLGQMDSVLRSDAEEAVVGGAPHAGDAGGPAEARAAGAIRSRADVVHALDVICDYYRQREPGSPVPFLLQRAQKLVNMNFVDAMRELNLATPESLRPSLGSTVDSAAPPPA